MFSSKQALKKLLAQGRTELVLTNILATTKPLTDQHFHNQATALSGRWSTNERNNNLGTLSGQDYNLEKERINQAVLVLIDEIPGRSAWLKWLLIAVIAMLMFYFLSKIISHSTHLTVFVQDATGKPIPELQNNGKILFRFGDDLRDPVIGENGRTNIGEIPSDFKGKEVEVVLVAEGWELVDPGKKYEMGAEQIYLKVRRDNSLGLIKGRVSTRDGNEFIGGAVVIINANGRDTTTLTDSLGYFQLVLPEAMQKEEYLLTVKKDGFQVARDRFRPKTSDADIRLEK